MRGTVPKIYLILTFQHLKDQKTWLNFGRCSYDSKTCHHELLYAKCIHFLYFFLQIWHWNCKIYLFKLFPCKNYLKQFNFWQNAHAFHSFLIRWSWIWNKVHNITSAKFFSLLGINGSSNTMPINFLPLTIHIYYSFLTLFDLQTHSAFSANGPLFPRLLPCVKTPIWHSLGLPQAQTSDMSEAFECGESIKSCWSCRIVISAFFSIAAIVTM